MFAAKLPTTPIRNWALEACCVLAEWFCEKVSMLLLKKAITITTSLEIIVEFESRCDNRQSSVYILLHPTTTPTSIYMHTQLAASVAQQYAWENENFIKTVGEAMHVASI